MISFLDKLTIWESNSCFSFIQYSMSSVSSIQYHPGFHPNASIFHFPFLQPHLLLISPKGLVICTVMNHANRSHTVPQKCQPDRSIIWILCLTHFIVTWPMVTDLTISVSTCLISFKYPQRELLSAQNELCKPSSNAMSDRVNLWRISIKFHLKTTRAARK